MPDVELPRTGLPVAADPLVAAGACARGTAASSGTAFTYLGVLVWDRPKRRHGYGPAQNDWRRLRRLRTGQCPGYSPQFSSPSMTYITLLAPFAMRIWAANRSIR